MNSLWLERFAQYRETPLALESAKALLELKDIRRQHLLARYGRKVELCPYQSQKTFQEALLCEARNAKDFWSVYRSLLPSSYGGFVRKPRAADVANRLLDVGYHHLASMVEKNIIARDISPSLGLIHRAQSATSKPLVYDVMELFRADMVDFALLRYLRLKKKPIIEAEVGQHIGHFLYDINTVREKLFYLQDFKQCHRYGYYMELQMLKFIRAVNRQEVFTPIMLPRRHDSRCASHAKLHEVGHKQALVDIKKSL